MTSKRKLKRPLSAEREAGKFATSWRSAERTSLVIKACAGSLRAVLQQTSGERGDQAWLLISGVLVQPS